MQIDSTKCPSDGEIDFSRIDRLLARACKRLRWMSFLAHLRWMFFALLAFVGAAMAGVLNPRSLEASEQMVLLACGIVILSALAVLASVRYFFYRASPADLAARVEQVAPEFGEKLITAVTLRDRERVDHDFLQSLVSSVNQEITGLKLARRLPLPSLYFPLGILAVLVTVAIGFAVKRPTATRDLMVRAFLPSDRRANLAGRGIEIDLKKSIVALDDAFEIAVTLPSELASRDAMVELDFPSRRETHDMRAEGTTGEHGERRLIWQLAHAAESFRFRVRVDHAWSGKHKVEVRPRPSIARVRLDVIPPDYLHRPRWEVTDWPTAIPRGSNLAVVAEFSDAIERASLTLGSRTRFDARESGERHRPRMTWKISADEAIDAQLRIEATSRDGLTFAPWTSSLKVADDLAPVIDVKRPEIRGSAFSARSDDVFAVDLHIFDDHGIGLVRLRCLDDRGKLLFEKELAKFPEAKRKKEWTWKKFLEVFDLLVGAEAGEIRFFEVVVSDHLPSRWGGPNESRIGLGQFLVDPEAELLGVSGEVLKRGELSQALKLGESALLRASMALSDLPQQFLKNEERATPTRLDEIAALIETAAQKVHRVIELAEKMNDPTLAAGLREISETSLRDGSQVLREGALLPIERERSLIHSAWLARWKLAMAQSQFSRVQADYFQHSRDRETRERLRYLSRQQEALANAIKDPSRLSELEEFRNSQRHLAEQLMSLLQGSSDEWINAATVLRDQSRESQLMIQQLFSSQQAISTFSKSFNSPASELSDEILAWLAADSLLVGETRKAAAEFSIAGQNREALLEIQSSVRERLGELRQAMDGMGSVSKGSLHLAVGQEWTTTLEAIRAAEDAAEIASEAINAEPFSAEIMIRKSHECLQSLALVSESMAMFERRIAALADPRQIAYVTPKTRRAIEKVVNAELPAESGNAADMVKNDFAKLLALVEKRTTPRSLLKNSETKNQ